jgi:hypothetical protein
MTVKRSLYRSALRQVSFACICTAEAAIPSEIDLLSF